MGKSDRKPLVILHYEGAGEIPYVYIDGEVEVLSVCDHAPDDRVYRFSQSGIPADLLESIKGEAVGHEGDGSPFEAQCKKAFAEANGASHLTLVKE